MLDLALKQFKVTSVMLDKAIKSPISINTVSAFGLYMFAEWSKLAKPLVTEAGNKSTTSTSWVDGFIKKIDTTMGKFQKNIEKEQAEYITYFYKYFKNEFIKKNKINIVKKADLPEVTPILWLEADEEAMAAIVRIISESSGAFYTSSVQTVVHESIKKNILEGNLPLAEAVERMKEDLAKALKLEPGSLASEVVPIGYRGTAESYFSSLADHAASVSRTTGAITTLDEIGAEKIIVRSVKSHRTCIGCLQMDGTEYEVSKVKKHVNKLLSADSTDDLKKIQPFFHFKSPDQYSEDALEAAENKAAGIASSGIHVPPFHFRCECFIDMV